MFNDLTIQQLCALDYSRNMAVTAGPGAGKTRILSLRFCFILLTDPSVTLPQILTLTFTEKAAEEMKGRIYDMLISLGKRFSRQGYDRLRERIRNAKEQFDRNRISTIHSFCANLLREHPVESGVDPDFKITRGMLQRMMLDNAIEESIKTIWDEDKDEIIPLLRSFGSKNRLISAVRNLSENSSLYERVIETKDRLFSISDWKEQVFNDYCMYLRDRFVLPYRAGLAEQEKRNETAEKLTALFNEWYPSREREDLSYNIPALFAGLRDLAGTAGRTKKGCRIDHGLRQLSYIDMIEEHFPDLFNLNNPDSIFEKELICFMKTVKASIERYSREKEQFNSLDFSDLETRSLMLLKRLLTGDRLSHLKEMQERYRYIMVDEFQDTNRIQWDIIRTLFMDTSRPDLNTLLPGKIFVVGDKRQAIYRFRGGDVTVFEKVNREITDSNRGTPPLFWQSEEMIQELKEIDECFDPMLQNSKFSMLSEPDRKKIMSGDVYLPHNFRSDLNPVEFFNRTFEQIFSSKHAGDIRAYETAPKDICLPEEKIKSPENKGSVAIYITDASDDSRKMSGPETEAFLIVNLIKSMLGENGTGSFEYRTYHNIREKIEKKERAIGILFYAFTNIRRFENIFREAGLSFIIHRGKGFYKSSEVMEMLQLLNYLVDERQEVSLLSCLRGRIFGLTDPEIFDLFYNRKGNALASMADSPHIKKIFNEIASLRQLASRLTISELIRTIISSRSLTAKYSFNEKGEQAILNMEKLIEIAQRFQAEERGSLPDFVRYCLDLAENDEDEGEAVITGAENSSISLMTIHAAKGLEFPMVILPQLGRRIIMAPDTGKAVRLVSSEGAAQGRWNRYEGDMPVWPVETPSSGFYRQKGPLMHLLMDRNNLEEVAENRRVFYVGCTRAENHLVLIGSGKNKKERHEHVELTSDDYRERANIRDLLDDIYRFDQEKEDTGAPDDPGFTPIIKRVTVKQEPFKGIRYNPEMPDPGSFGPYNESIKRLDLTSPITASPYFQLSYTSVRNYFKCPYRFYFNTLLKLPEGDYTQEHDDYLGEKDMILDKGDDYSTGDALFTGNFVHAYLEKHRFGTPFDDDHFELVKRGMKPSDCNIDMCLERVKGLLMNTVADKNLISLMQNSSSYSEVPFLVTALPGIEFRGVIDRIFKEPGSGCWSIIDWKSNDLEEKSPEMVIEENTYDIQLAFYKWAVERILKEKVEKQYIYFLSSGHLLECDWQGDPIQIFEEISQEMKRIEEQGILKGLERKKQGRGGECRFCGYKGVVCL